MMRPYPNRRAIGAANMLPASAPSPPTAKIAPTPRVESISSVVRKSTNTAPNTPEPKLIPTRVVVSGRTIGLRTSSAYPSRILRTISRGPA